MDSPNLFIQMQSKTMIDHEFPNNKKENIKKNEMNLKISIIIGSKVKH